MARKYQEHLLKALVKMMMAISCLLMLLTVQACLRSYLLTKDYVRDRSFL